VEVEELDVRGGMVTSSGRNASLRFSASPRGRLSVATMLESPRVRLDDHEGAEETENEADEGEDVGGSGTEHGAPKDSETRTKRERCGALVCSGAATARSGAVQSALLRRAVDVLTRAFRVNPDEADAASTAETAEAALRDGLSDGTVTAVGHVLDALGLDRQEAYDRVGSDGILATLHAAEVLEYVKLASPACLPASRGSDLTSLLAVPDASVAQAAAACLAHKARMGADSVRAMEDRGRLPVSPQRPLPEGGLPEEWTAPDSDSPPLRRLIKGEEPSGGHVDWSRRPGILVAAAAAVVEGTGGRMDRALERVSSSSQGQQAAMRAHAAVQAAIGAMDDNERRNLTRNAADGMLDVSDRSALATLPIVCGLCPAAQNVSLPRLTRADVGACRLCVRMLDDRLATLQWNGEVSSAASVGVRGSAAGDDGVGGGLHH
jgi:hypothetical protein